MVCNVSRARRSLPCATSASNNSVTWPVQVIWSPTWVPQQHLREYGVRFVAITQVGDQITCTGQVTELFEAEVAHGTERRARLTLQTTNQHGQVKLTGDAAIALD